MNSLLLLSMLLGTASLFSDLLSAEQLTGHQWRHRPIVVLNATPQFISALEREWGSAEAKSGAADRDMVFLAAGPGAVSSQLVKKFGVPADKPVVLLVGKDGGRKLSSEKVVGPDEIFPLIDSMPMRRREMRGEPE